MWAAVLLCRVVLSTQVITWSNERISVAFRQHGNSMLSWSHTLMMLANTLAASSVSLHPHKFSSTMVWLLRRPSLSACRYGNIVDRTPLQVTSANQLGQSSGCVAQW